jgi:hypothetical protein
MDKVGFNLSKLRGESWHIDGRVTCCHFFFGMAGIMSYTISRRQNNGTWPIFFVQGNSHGKSLASLVQNRRQSPCNGLWKDVPIDANIASAEYLVMSEVELGK